MKKVFTILLFTSFLLPIYADNDYPPLNKDRKRNPPMLAELRVKEDRIVKQKIIKQQLAVGLKKLNKNLVKQEKKIDEIKKSMKFFYEINLLNSDATSWVIHFETLAQTMKNYNCLINQCTFLMQLQQEYFHTGFALQQQTLQPDLNLVNIKHIFKLSQKNKKHIYDNMRNLDGLQVILPDELSHAFSLRCFYYEAFKDAELTNIKKVLENLLDQIIRKRSLSNKHRKHIQSVLRYTQEDVQRLLNIKKELEEQLKNVEVAAYHSYSETTVRNLQNSVQKNVIRYTDHNEYPISDLKDRPISFQINRLNIEILLEINKTIDPNFELESFDCIEKEKRKRKEVLQECSKRKVIRY